MSVKLYHGDCLDILPTLAADSVDTCITDPPYYRVKKAAWDNQWESVPDYLAWLDRVLAEFERVLKFNGSLYLFASPKIAARVEVLISGRFNVLNSIVWRKHNGSGTSAAEGACKAVFRSYFPQTERIIFAEHYNSDNAAKGEAGYGRKCDELRGFVFEPLRAYLDGEKERAGLSSRQVDQYLGNYMSGHYFGASQWALPTRENYLKMRECFHALSSGGDYLRREYEDLRRPFSVSADVPYTDVWDFPTVQGYKGKHECEKPLAMLRHIVKASSRPGDTVMDTFYGSGNTGKASELEGRNFIGIERDAHWYEYGKQRIEQAKPENLPLFKGRTA